MLVPKSYSISRDYNVSSTMISKGVAGKVYPCVQKLTNKKFAVKIILDDIKARREIDLHFRACQNCPFIVQIRDVYENYFDGKPSLYIVLELMEGGELFHKISKRPRPFTEQEIAMMMFQICSAVKHLHDMQIAHRDLKPENLLLSSNDENAVIKLADFGFAKEVKDGLRTPCFTPYYVAPEIFGESLYDVSCDIWSLGVIMYILCSGLPPFYSKHGQNFSPGMKRRILRGDYKFLGQGWENVSNDGKELIKGMLETVPQERLTIDQVMKSKWISNYHSVPQTPLPSVDNLRDAFDDWEDIQRDMDEALEEMRVNYAVKINNPTPTTNPILKRREMQKEKKLRGDNKATSGARAESTLNLRQSLAPSHLSLTRRTVEADGLTIEDLSPYIMQSDNSPIFPGQKPKENKGNKSEDVELADSNSVRHWDSIVIEDLSRENSMVAPKPSQNDRTTLRK